MEEGNRNAELGAPPPMIRQTSIEVEAISDVEEVRKHGLYKYILSNDTYDALHNRSFLLAQLEYLESIA